MLGLLGGLLGTSMGVLAVVLTAVGKRWTPILEPAGVLPAPLLGALTGLLAGLYRPGGRVGSSPRRLCAVESSRLRRRQGGRGWPIRDEQGGSPEMQIRTTGASRR
jgi:hypothetical protein